MKRRLALLMIGVMFGLTACGTQQSAEAPTEQTQEASETAPEAAEDTGNEQEQGEYIEDTVISTDLLTITIPDEFKGKVLAKVDGNEICIYDKASVDAGFNGFVFSVIVFV